MARRDVSLTPAQLDLICEALQRWQNTFLARNPDTTHMTDDEIRKARYRAYQTAQQPLELLRELHSWSYPKPPAGEA